MVDHVARRHLTGRRRLVHPDRRRLRSSRHRCERRREELSSTIEREADEARGRIRQFSKKSEKRLAEGRFIV
jgi:hypothetical protein